MTATLSPDFVLRLVLKPNKGLLNQLNSTRYFTTFPFHSSLSLKSRSSLQTGDFEFPDVATVAPGLVSRQLFLERSTSSVIMSNVLENFGCLDELTQVIYQSIYKFVVLSTVTDDKWNIHVGLSGSQGRWWHGFWTEDDIHRIFGSKSSDKLLETFAEKLAEAFIQGELCISDWSAEKGANIKFTLGPTSKKPMHVSLVEMSPEDAAAHATSVFINIAVQAQSRKCRLYPSTADYPTLPIASSTSYQTTHVASVTVPSGSKRKGTSPPPEPRKVEASTSSKHNGDVRQKEEIKSSKSQSSNVKQKTGKLSENPVAPAARVPKGASLANPSKKARVYKPIEFGSDDEY